mmetsp:Transcript_20379/g.28427  ORF Transcript_20379/g.28427 Transcript_20379/m.28427 type:complete len:324 (-) Transcript_20379:1158-2129(-)
MIALVNSILISFSFSYTRIKTIKTISLGTLSIAQIVMKSFGPSGNFKLLYNINGRLCITKNTMRILRNLILDNPTSIIILRLLSVFDINLNDGTAYTLILISSLMKWLSGINIDEKDTSKILLGLRYSLKVAYSSISKNSTTRWNNLNRNSLYWWLYNSVKTSLTTKMGFSQSSYFTKMSILATVQTNDNKDNIKLTLLLGGDPEESFLDYGIVIKNISGINNDYLIENSNIYFTNTLLTRSKSSNQDTFLHFIKRNLNYDVHNNLDANVRRYNNLLNTGFNILISYKIIGKMENKFLNYHSIFFIDNIDLESVNITNRWYHA